MFQALTGILQRLPPPLATSGFRSKAQPAVRNPSLSPKGIEIAIRCNDLLDTREKRTFRRFLQKAFKQRPGEKHTLFSEAQRRELLAFYAPSNQQCVDEFLDSQASGRSYLLGIPEAVRSRGQAYALRMNFARRKKFATGFATTGPKCRSVYGEGNRSPPRRSRRRAGSFATRRRSDGFSSSCSAACGPTAVATRAFRVSEKKP